MEQQYVESAYKIVLGLPKDGHNYLDVMSRVLKAIKKEFDDTDHGAMFIQGVNMEKEAKELADLYSELAEYREAYNDLKAKRDAGL